MRRIHLFVIAAFVAACGATAGSSSTSVTAPPDAAPAADAGTPTAGVGTQIADLPTSLGLMPSTAGAWQPFSPRVESAPATSMSGGAGGYGLQILGGGGSTTYGGWTTRISGLQGGSWYRFGARARPMQVGSLRESVTIVLRWRGSFGDEVSPDYVWDFQKQSDGTLAFDRAIQAPNGTTAVDVELVLQWSSLGQVVFDHLSFTPIAAPSPRRVRIAAIRYRPSGTKSGAESLQQAARYAEQVAAAQHPDVIVLGELLNVVGAPGTFDANAETVPGPSTDFVAAIARAQNVNIAFGMVERSGGALYNTAVLLDRSGTIVGKHHKVQLPLSDASAGVTPGDAVEVFDTDFGRVALLICQDISFPEPAREAALLGAELLVVPIWGGKTTLVHARAMENGIHLAAAGYDYASEVVNPLGDVLASVAPTGGPGAAVAEIDLSQRFREAWLGDWHDISMKERRAKPYQYQLP